MTRVLVVEDSELAVGLRANLELEGYAVDVAATGASLPRRANIAAALRPVTVTMARARDSLRFIFQLSA